MESTIMVRDSIAAKYLFDPEYITKGCILGFAGVSYNHCMTKGRYPSIFCNGADHDEKKENSLKVFHQRFGEIKVADMNKIVQGGFESFNDLKEGDDFEVAVDKMAFHFNAFLVLGKVIPDHANYRDWFERCIRPDLKQKLLWPFLYKHDERVTEEVFRQVSETPTIKNLEKIAPNMTDTKEGSTLDLMFNTYFNGSPLLGKYAISCLARYVDSLTDEERQSLKAEADHFLEQDPSQYDESFEGLELINSFVLEVLRLNPVHITGTYGKARKDFVMESKTGRYQIYKDDLITDCVMEMHRDPRVFEEPSKVKLTRDNQKVKENLVNFGGPWLQESTSTNRKCPGQNMMYMGLKLFVIHLTRSTFDVKSDLTYTGKNPKRGYGTDIPVVMKKFAYNK
eukprot:TCONS_00069281-protein